MSFVSFLLQTEAVADPTGGPFGMLLPLILIIGIMYFLMIRPQNKKQKETQKMLDALQKGDKVVTIGGIRGTIASVKKDSNTVVIKVDDNVKIEFNRSAVAGLTSEKSPRKAEPEAPKSEKKGLFAKKKQKEEPTSEQPKASDASQAAAAEVSDTAQGEQGKQPEKGANEKDAKDE